MDIEITVHVKPSTIPVRGNAMASGDDDFDFETENRIIAKAENNVWAWCDITVRGTWKGLTGEAHLGACSYDSEKDFRENSGYFDDMVAHVRDEIDGQAAEIRNFCC